MPTMVPDFSAPNRAAASLSQAIAPRILTSTHLFVLGERELLGGDRRHGARRVDDQIEAAEVFADGLEERGNLVELGDVVDVGERPLPERLRAPSD